MSQYPTAELIVERVRQSGVVDPDFSRCQFALQSAIRALERETGFRPFLASLTAISEYRFRPDGTGVVDFARDGGPGGFVEVTGVWFSVTHAFPAGLPQQEGRDYRLYPHNAALQGRAYLWLVSSVLRYEDEEPSVLIAGRAGAVGDLPEDLYEAICAEAVAQYRAVQQSVAGDVARFRQGDVEVEYRSGEASAGGMMAGVALSDVLRRTARAYRRLRMG